ncbi:hypothetical protein V1264_003310 [Littorina saxatilis]|uniref:C-type lectin domain-containing protein n=1 Tax=Littorina saxatilis TaxID=31220 RepID=A0AAN9G855_9CAEN
MIFWIFVSAGLFSTVAAHTDVDAATSCPFTYSWFSYNDTLYAVSNNTVTDYDTARQCCQGLGPNVRLTVIENDDVITGLMTYIQSKFGTGAAEVWVDATRKGAYPTPFTWPDGRTVSPDLWDPIEPQKYDKYSRFKVKEKLLKGRGWESQYTPFCQGFSRGEEQQAPVMDTYTRNTESISTIVSLGFSAEQLDSFSETLTTDNALTEILSTSPAEVYMDSEVILPTASTKVPSTSGADFPEALTTASLETKMGSEYPFSFEILPVLVSLSPTETATDLSDALHSSHDFSWSLPESNYASVVHHSTAVSRTIVEQITPVSGSEETQVPDLIFTSIRLTVSSTQLTSSDLDGTFSAEWTFHDSDAQTHATGFFDGVTKSGLEIAQHTDLLDQSWSGWTAGSSTKSGDGSTSERSPGSLATTKVTLLSDWMSQIPHSNYQTEYFSTERTDTLTSATVSEPTSPDVGKNILCQSCNCAFHSRRNSQGNETKDKVMEKINRIRAYLSVNKSTLSRSVRKKISADDKRTSARAVGCVGLVFLLVVLLPIVLLDLQRLFSKKVEHQRDNQKLN